VFAKAITAPETGLNIWRLDPLSKKQSLDAIAVSLSLIAQTMQGLVQDGADAGPALGPADAYHWDAEAGVLAPVAKVSRVPFELLKGIESVRDTLLQNTLQFARGHGANNALLWGARGMGKSSLVKAVHAHVGTLAEPGMQRLILIEIAREDIETLPRLMRAFAEEPARFIIFCDDLSFDKEEASYKSLKTILDGGLEGRPENVLFYATSNRRHLMARDMIDNERSSAINPNEAIDEKISLSDRFGLWLGFHHCDQETFLGMIRAYTDFYGIGIDNETLRAKAVEWSVTRGARSGRVAIQFVRNLAGEMGIAV
jgi:predicted AAA+ superfamily ATPase